MVLIMRSMFANNQATAEAFVNAQPLRATYFSSTGIPQRWEDLMYPEILGGDAATHALLTCWLDVFGQDACELLSHANCRYVVLEADQRFSDVSGVLRRMTSGVDSWPIPPAGLVVVEDRLAIFRTV